MIRVNIQSMKGKEGGQSVVDEHRIERLIF